MSDRIGKDPNVIGSNVRARVADREFNRKNSEIWLTFNRISHWGLAGKKLDDVRHRMSACWLM